MPLKLSWKKYNNENDNSLVDTFQESGDLEILGLLYERYMHLVYGVCMKYFKDQDEAKDGVTSIFEKLIIELPKHEVGNFKSWLYVLTKNFCLMKIRSSNSEQKKHQMWQKDQAEFMESDFEMHLIDKDDGNLNQTLLECINKLKEDQQKCIQQFYFDNRSYKEIAMTLKMDEKKVKSYIQNGKRNLKLCIESKHGKTA